MTDTSTTISLHEIEIPAGHRMLQGILRSPSHPHGIILFAHGSGSSRFSPRNTYVAEQLAQAHFASLLFDLLTAEEEHIDARTAELRFDIPLLAGRLGEAIAWVQGHDSLKMRKIGLFGASTGAAAALVAAAHRPAVAAIVSRGGRPDLAGSVLAEVRAPTLLIVGGEDYDVLRLNRKALAGLTCEARVEVVPHATHLFVEPGALERVSSLAATWFTQHLAPGTTQ